MSLLRPVIRGCAVAALRDQSWAQSRVYDSDFTPLVQAVQGTENAPYIVVYTDADDNQPIPGVNEIYNGDNRNLQVVLEIGIASAVSNPLGGANVSSATLKGGSATTKAFGSITFVSNPHPGDMVTINATPIVFQTVPATNQIGIGPNLLATLSSLLVYLRVVQDPNLLACSYALTTTNTLTIFAATAGEAGNSIPIAANITAATLRFAHADFASELAVDAVCSQALAALFGNPHSQWGELYKRFTMHLRRMPTRRGGQSQGGIRFAARRITLVHSTIWDLMPGIKPTPNHPIWEFISLANKTPLPGPAPQSAGTIQDMANTIQSLLTAVDNADWRQAQTMLGLTKRGVRHLFVPGTPTPLPHIEEPPLDWSDPNEFVPPFTDITIAGGANPAGTVIEP